MYQVMLFSLQSYHYYFHLVSASGKTTCIHPSIRMIVAQNASELGCTQQYVSLILKGKENLTLETIAKLESALQIDLWGQPCMVDGYQPTQPTRQYLSDIDTPEYGDKRK